MRGTIRGLPDAAALKDRAFASPGYQTTPPNKT